MERCAACGKSIENQEHAESGVYSPNEKFLLCISCFEDEEKVIERMGTNVVPPLLALYRRPRLCTNKEKQSGISDTGKPL